MDMGEPVRAAANLQESQKHRMALNEFDAATRVRIPSRRYTAEYAVDMSLEELFDDQQIGVEEKGSIVRLTELHTDEVGRYHWFEYQPCEESEQANGYLRGVLGGEHEDLTEYADDEALRFLGEVAGSLTL